MLESYSQRELDELVTAVAPRRGWDLNGMNVLRQPVPWDYEEIVTRYLRPTDYVLDIGTGGGETLARLAASFGHGVGIDLDPAMIGLARQNSGTANLEFLVSSERLEGVTRVLAFMEYDVEYVVRDIESLVFWLNALDCPHADIDGSAALASAAALNAILAGNVDERGFVTNEHRYLAVAQAARG